VANRKKTKKKRKPSHPLPKVGTPKDDAYRLKHSREDVVDFGLMEPKKGILNWIIVAVVVGLLALGAVALILFT
jgi:hypothetical protein